jgi:predicted Zn-dependent protease
MLAPGVVPPLSSVTAEDSQAGQSALDQLTRSFPLSRDRRDIGIVRRIVDRLTTVGLRNSALWHVYVFDDDRVKNAAATRGDYIFVWSGMIRYVRNDAELAAILAHEIGHVLAGHVLPNPADRLNGSIAGIGGAIAQQVFRGPGAAGLAAQLGGALVSESIKGLIVNPESQRKEYEADQIGLFLMADAGYDPKNAVEFWRRTVNDPEFSASNMEFFSSHPSSKNRTLRLEGLLPEAQMRYYRRGRPDRNYR